ncbi:MAG TPA: ArsR family transcriptional regulator [Nitrososphaerales archaeon]|nr:ArsR family transcriptional regulator [Nitrososphaerales archaeon]
MDKEELDSALQVMENPVRRRIIKRLSQEPAYALQLSKELGLGQPLVAKHLATMENAGLVKTVSKDSPNGPRRKLYSLAKGISITMDVGPNLFIARGMAFEAKQGKEKTSQEVSQLRHKVQHAIEENDESKKLSLLSEALGEVDRRMDEIEQERFELLGVRNFAMREASMVASKFDELDTRRVLFHILDEHDRGVERISEALNLRELSVKSILEELEDYFG